jgi:hypothetical protein
VETTVTTNGHSRRRPAFGAQLEHTIAWFEQRIQILQNRNARLEEALCSYRLLVAALIMILISLAILVAMELWS